MLQLIDLIFLILHYQICTCIKCPHYLFVAVCTLCIIGGKRCMCNVTPVMGTAPPVHPVRECVYNEAPVMDTAPPAPPAEKSGHLQQMSPTGPNRFGRA